MQWEHNFESRLYDTMGGKEKMEGNEKTMPMGSFMRLIRANRERMNPFLILS